MAHRLSPEAEADLDQIWDYITKESGSPAAAKRVVTSITDRFFLLATHPALGRRRDDLRPGLRSFVVGSYIILYIIQSDDVLIVRVFHSRRDIKRIFDD